MGGMISIECKSCDFTREASVGVGMMGIGVELCPCYTCCRFVKKEVDHREGLQPLILKCPYCRKAIEPVKRGDKCAVCAGRLTIETLGEWD